MEINITALKRDLEEMRVKLNDILEDDFTNHEVIRQSEKMDALIVAYYQSIKKGAGECIQPHVEACMD